MMVLPVFGYLLVNTVTQILEPLSYPLVTIPFVLSGLSVPCFMSKEKAVIVSFGKVPTRLQKIRLTGNFCGNRNFEEVARIAEGV